MVQQITKGIKVSVIAKYEGTRYQNLRMYHTFSYQISIENQTTDSVQLIRRHWNIYDSLKKTEIVNGDGVIGKKPILSPMQTYTYNSHCFLTSPIGAMQGYYEMLNYTTAQYFRVHIPTFQLMVPASLN